MYNKPKYIKKPARRHDRGKDRSPAKAMYSAIGVQCSGGMPLATYGTCPKTLEPLYDKINLKLIPHRPPGTSTLEPSPEPTLEPTPGSTFRSRAGERPTP